MCGCNSGDCASVVIQCASLTFAINAKGAFLTLCRFFFDLHACGIGYVMQNPETQIVTDTCISELAFGLQSLGMDSDAISAKIGEVAGFFGIGDRYGEKTHTLSGGQKQLLSLASVMAMKPSLLLLDEPTSQLDPVAAREFLGCLKKLNDELGVTVIMSEHRLDEAFPLANRVVMLENGSVLLDDTPENMGRRLRSLPNGGSKHIELPTPLRIYRALGGSCDAPLTVKDGRAYILTFKAVSLEQAVNFSASHAIFCQ